MFVYLLRDFDCLIKVIGVSSLSRKDFQNDPGVLAAVKFLLKNAHREGFFENSDNSANLQSPQRIRGTRIVSKTIWYFVGKFYGYLFCGLQLT